MEARLQAAEMWFLCRMMKISWVDKISNDEVLLRANTTWQLMQTIIARQLRFVGHVIRKGKLEYLMLTGKIEGKRARESTNFDISRLVGTIYWHKATGPYHKVAKTTRERCCGCRQRQDPAWIGSEGNRRQQTSPLAFIIPPAAGQ